MVSVGSGLYLICCPNPPPANLMQSQRPLSYLAAPWIAAIPLGAAPHKTCWNGGSAVDLVAHPRGILWAILQLIFCLRWVRISPMLMQAPALRWRSRKGPWTASWGSVSMNRIQGHMMTSWHGNAFRIIGLCGFPPQRAGFFALNVIKLLNKQSNCRCLGTPWRSCDVTLSKRHSRGRLQQWYINEKYRSHRPHTSPPWASYGV